MARGFKFYLALASVICVFVSHIITIIDLLILLSGIISLIIAILTYKKQWKLFEMMDGVDEILRRDFTLLTPKQVYSTIIQISIAVSIMIIGCLISLTFYVYNVVLNFPSWMICISYFLYNMPYATLLLLFYFSSNTIKRRKKAPLKLKVAK